jgi:hypothetical protein
MGRRTVHNGGLPGSLPYDSVGNICRWIESEREDIGNTDVELAAATRRFLNLPDDWLTTEYHTRRTAAARGPWWNRLINWRAP